MPNFVTLPEGHLFVDRLFAAFPEGAVEGGGVLRGTLVRYGDVSQRYGFRVRFERGAFGELPRSSRLNVQHDRGRPVAILRRGDELQDSDQALTIKARIADTADGRNLMEGVRAGLYTGFSAEVWYEKVRWVDDDLMECAKARLMGAAVVDKPGLPASVFTKFELGFVEDLPSVLPGLF